MTKIDSLKKELKTMHELEGLTNMLEQSAARSISKMRTTILESRTFFGEVWKIYGVLKKLTPPPPEVVHKHLVVLIGIDWGMPGGLLNKVIAKTKEVQAEQGADLLIAGKMAHNHFRDQDGETTHFFSSPKNATLADIQPIYKVVANYAKVTIIYPRFESLSKQPIMTASFSLTESEQSLQAERAAQVGSSVNEIEIAAKRFIIDPNPQEIANYLNEAVVGLTVHHYFAEAFLAYSAAQMIAMRNSHDNAKQESGKLFVRYNAARRSVIDAKIREVYSARAAAKNKETRV